MIFRTRRVWWMEWGALIAAVFSFWYGFAIFLGLLEINKVLFGSPAFTRWVMGIGGPFAGAAFAYVWLGAKRGFPRIEITPSELKVVNLFGRHSLIDLADHGPAYVYETKSPVTMFYLVFYKSAKEAALKRTGSFVEPTEFTADTKVQLSYLVGKGLPSAFDIARAVNSVRSNVEPPIVSEAHAKRLIAEHRRAARIGAFVLIFLIVGGGMFEFLAEREFSWLWVTLGLIIAACGFFLNHLEHSANRWIQGVRVAIIFAIIVLAILLVSKLILFAYGYIA